MPLAGALRLLPRACRAQSCVSHACPARTCCRYILHFNVGHVHVHSLFCIVFVLCIRVPLSQWCSSLTVMHNFFLRCFDSSVAGSTRLPLSVCNTYYMLQTWIGHSQAQVQGDYPHASVVDVFPMECTMRTLMPKPQPIIRQFQSLQGWWHA